MFNGIIQAVGTIKNIKKTSGGALFCFKVNNNFLTTVKVGDSIASNGVCLTITKLKGEYFYADLSQETLNLTTFSLTNTSDKVNFEKSLRLNQGIDGHLVSGHIDAMASISTKKILGDNIMFEISAPNNLLKYIVKKGSITINGISLTINSIKDNIFSVNIVPHTLKSTNLIELEVGSLVNIEIDIIARHLEKLIK